MELTKADIKAIKDLLDQLPEMVEQHGYPYAFGASRFWLNRIVEQSHSNEKTSANS
jgi:hypothetical protein